MVTMWYLMDKLSLQEVHAFFPFSSNFGKEAAEENASTTKTRNTLNTCINMWNIYSSSY
jgi:hypothetical protein